MKETLKKEGYKLIKFKLSITNHLFIKARINGVLGDFIVDTGASNSCLDYSYTDHFNISPEPSTTKASGAGANDMHTQIALHNRLQIGRWHNKDFNLVILDLSHVNIALVDYGVKTVHGIIGSDLLLGGNAIIDYKERVIYIK